MDSQPFEMEAGVQKIGAYFFKEQVISCDKHASQTCSIRRQESEQRWTATYCPACESEKEAQAKKEQELTEAARLKRAEQARIEKQLDSSMIPARFQTRSFENYLPENDKAKKIKEICQEYAESFDVKMKCGASIVFCGNTGTGKSHLACAIANYIIGHKQKSALFVKVIKAIRSVKETYSGGSEQEAINTFTKPDLLVLDEVGVQFGTDTEKQILFEILNERYENFKPTMLISNLAANELKDFIGDRALDRMKENGGLLLTCDWESYRSKAYEKNAMRGL